MENKRIAKKSGLYFIGNMASKSLQALLLPIYAFYVTKEDLGYFDYSQTIMNIVVPLAFLAIWEGILKFTLSENDEISRDKILSTSILFSVVMCCVLVSITFGFNYFVFEGKHIFSIVLMIVSHGLAMIWQYCARAVGQSKVYVTSGVVSTFINFALVIALVCFTKLGIQGLYISYFVGQFSIIVLIEHKIKIFSRISKTNIDFLILKKILIFSAPLVVNFVSMWFIYGYGRLIITNDLGPEVNGMYTFASKFAVIVTMLGTVITMAIIEEAILASKSKDFAQKFSQMISNLFRIFLSLIMVSFPAIKLFYYFISDTEYYSSINYVPILLAFSVFMTMSSNIGSIFQVVDKTKYQFITTVLGGIITVVIPVFYIDSMGIYSVIIGQMMGALVMMLSRYYLARRYIKVEINWLKIGFGFLVFGIISIVCLSYNPVVSLYVLLIILIGVAYINKSFIHKGMGALAKRRISKRNT